MECEYGLSWLSRNDSHRSMIHFGKITSPYLERVENREAKNLPPILQNKLRGFSLLPAPTLKARGIVQLGKISLEDKIEVRNAVNLPILQFAGENTLFGTAELLEVEDPKEWAENFRRLNLYVGDEQVIGFLEAKVEYNTHNYGKNAPKLYEALKELTNEDALSRKYFDKKKEQLEREKMREIGEMILRLFNRYESLEGKDSSERRKSEKMIREGIINLIDLGGHKYSSPISSQKASGIVIIPDVFLRDLAEIYKIPIPE